jgi:hypothetical protein
MMPARWTRETTKLVVIAGNDPRMQDLRAKLERLIGQAEGAIPTRTRYSVAGAPNAAEASWLP